MKNYKNVILVILITFLNYITIELACSPVRGIFNRAHPVGIFLGFAVILIINLVVVTLIPNRTVALLITSCCALLFSVINYYTLMYHGQPLTTAEISNAKTAKNVLGSYSFSISNRIIFMIGILAVEAVILFLLRKEKEKAPLTFKLGTIGALLGLCFIGFNFWIPFDAVTWSWQASINNYGYIPCEVQFERKLMNFLKQPEDFDKSVVKNQMQQYVVEESSKKNTPDVILILNESFYDLSYLTEITTDKTIFTNLYNSENSITGYALSPIVAGCTNNSEYEFLTSNSTHLLPGVTPFNVLDLENSNSVVSHLEGLGYSSVAWHSETKDNYNRGNGYTGLGFDETHFEGDFPNAVCYEDRYYLTDESIYEQVIQWYEGMSEDPRLIYGLTIQNHGSYNISDDANDIVHVGEDYGEYTDDINEYNTSIYLSDQALGKLFEYFSEHNDRQVVVCMVGDHCPSFAPELVADTSDSLTDQKLKSVPFIIWTNTPNGLDLTVAPDNSISMPYMIPTLLKAAGIELSKYYDYMLSIRDEMPKFYVWESWFDGDNQQHSYSESNDLLNQYFEWEYFNIKYPTEFSEVNK